MPVGDSDPDDEAKKVVLEGELLKKNTKKNKLAKKYDRRYFELTAVTLSYAKERKALLDMKKEVQVFNIDKMKGIKTCEDPTKFIVTFPHRSLKLKAIDTVDAERWVNKLNSLFVAAGSGRSLEGDAGAGGPNTRRESGGSGLQDSLAEQEIDEPIPDAPMYTAPSSKKALPSINDLALPKPAVEAVAATEKKKQGPPSPRSLLANPRAFASSYRVHEDAESSDGDEQPAPADQGRARTTKDQVIHLDDRPSPSDVSGRIANLQVQPKEQLELSDADSPTSTPTTTQPLPPAAHTHKSAAPAANKAQQDWLDEDWDSSSGDDSGDDGLGDDSGDDFAARAPQTGPAANTAPVAQEQNHGLRGTAAAAHGPSADDGNWVEEDWDSDDD